MKQDRIRLMRLVLFAAVYFVEGAMLTYFSAFNVLYLRSFDMKFSLIGIVSGIALTPFVLKIAIGYLSDRVSLFKKGNRKPYILLGLALQAIAFFLIPAVSPVSSPVVFILLMFLAALGMSTYDTTTDGLSIDTTPQKDRGLVQGLMVGGRALSSIVAAAIMGILAQNGQWGVIFLIIAALTILVMVLAIFVKEDKDRAPEKSYAREAFRSFKDPSLLFFLVLGIIYPLALYSAQGMVGAYLNEGLKISLATVGIYTSVFGVGTILGGVIGGPLMRKVGEKKSIYAAIILTAIVTYALALIPSAGFLWVVVFLFGFAFGYYETIYFAMGMDFADPRIAAFMFSIIMAVGNFGIAAGQPLAGTLVEKMGFQPMFLVFASIHLLAVPVVYLIFKLKRKQNKAIE